MCVAALRTAAAEPEPAKPKRRYTRFPDELGDGQLDTASALARDLGEVLRREHDPEEKIEAAAAVKQMEEAIAAVSAALDEPEAEPIPAVAETEPAIVPAIPAPSEEPELEAVLAPELIGVPAEEIEAQAAAQDPEPVAVGVAAATFQAEPVSAAAALPAEPPRRAAAPAQWDTPPTSARQGGDWRRELTNRVEAYRSRRDGGEESQDPLPFAQRDEAAATTVETAAEEPSPRAGLRMAPRRRPEGVEFVSVQPEFDFATSAGAEEEDHPQAQLVPVADLGERRMAGLLDLGFVAASYAVFLIYFSSLGGKLTFGRMETAIFGISLFLFYAQYYALFTIFGGTTPGMMLRKLRAVGFDGNRPAARQLIMRSFGYLVSAGALGLGFVWSLWDEDHLTWHDRMSHTYLTHDDPVSE